MPISTEFEQATGSSVKELQPIFIGSDKKGHARKASNQNSPPPLWSEEFIGNLRRGLCKIAPGPQDPYWGNNQIWIECTEITPLTSFREKAPARDLELTIKVVGRSDLPDVWTYFTEHRKALAQALAAAEGQVEIKAIEYRQGSLIIALVIGFKAAAALTGLIIGILNIFANYDKTRAGMRDATTDCKAFVEKMRHHVHDFFTGHDGSPGFAGI